MSFIEEARAVEVFGRITEKWAKVKPWSILPGDVLWNMLKKVAQFCTQKNFDITMFIESRYDKYFFWARNRMGVQTLPYKLLLSPKPEEVYLEYEQKVHRMWKDTTEAFIEDKHFILRSILQDALWVKKKLAIVKEQLPIYLQWFHPYALAVDPDYIDFVLLGRLEPTQQILEVWNNIPLTDTLRKISLEVYNDV